MPETQGVSSIVLNSWKEIASYVGRGVRTVQRWEADLGMPVRRPRAKSRSAVIAMSDEIDRWLRSAPTAELQPVRVVEKQGPEINSAILGLKQSMSEHATLRTRCTELREIHAQALARLMSDLHEMKRTVVGRKPSAPPDQL